MLLLWLVLHIPAALEREEEYLRLNRKCGQLLEASLPHLWELVLGLRLRRRLRVHVAHVNVPFRVP